MKKFVCALLLLSVMLVSSPAICGDITATGSSQGDLYKLLSNVSTALLNRCNTAPVVAASATTTNVKTTNTLQFTIAGQNYTASANSDITGLSASAQAVNTYCYYLLTINSSGSYALTKGNDRSTDSAVLPALPASSAPVGFVKVVTTSTAFTFGTSALDSADFTVTYGDIGTMPTGSSRVGLKGW